MSVEFSGLDAQAVLFKLGQLKAKKEVLQTASEVAQLFDMFQYSNCLKLQNIKDAQQQAQFAREIQKSEEKLMRYLVTMRSGQSETPEQFEADLARWTAEALRDSEDIADKLKNQIDNAKNASPILRIVLASDLEFPGATRATIAELTDALGKYFATEEDVRRLLVRLNAYRDLRGLSTLMPHQNVQEMIFHIIEYSDARNRFPELLAALSAEKPAVKEISNLDAMFSRSKERGTYDT